MSCEYGWDGSDKEGTKNLGNSLESSIVFCRAVQLQNTTLVLTLNAFDYAGFNYIFCRFKYYININT